MIERWGMPAPVFYAGLGAVVGLWLTGIALLRDPFEPRAAPASPSAWQAPRMAGDLVLDLQTGGRAFCAVRLDVAAQRLLEERHSIGWSGDRLAFAARHRDTGEGLIYRCEPDGRLRVWR